jgi:hypothetical protein
VVVSPSSAAAPKTPGGVVADEGGREAEIDPGRRVEPAERVGGQVEDGGAEVVEQLIRAAGAVGALAALIAGMLVPLALYGHAQLLYQPVRPSGRVAATTKMTAPARK